MVNYGRFRCFPMSHALLAQRMALKVYAACLSPSGVVSPFISAPYILRMHRLMFLAVLIACVHQFRASRMSAWHLWSHRHASSPLFPCMKKFRRHLPAGTFISCLLLHHNNITVAYSHSLSFTLIFKNDIYFLQCCLVQSEYMLNTDIHINSYLLPLLK